MSAHLLEVSGDSASYPAGLHELDRGRHKRSHRADIDVLAPC
jgi:hypothetical protein